MTVTVRSATASDADLVVARRLDFLREVRGSAVGPSESLEDETRVFFDTETSQGRLHTWIAEDDGTFVGIVSLLLWPRPPLPEDPRTNEAYIINMFVPPGHRSKGVGSLLLAQCLDRASDLNIRKLLLNSTEAGRHLYESAGFAPNPRWMELKVEP